MKYFLVTCFGILLLSCSQNTNNKKEIVFPQTENVVVNILGDSSIIGIPLEMEKFESLLLISDFQGDSLIWVFDLSKNRMVKRWVSKGKGPNEFQSPIQMVLIDSILFIQGRSQFTSQKFTINQSLLTLEPVEPLIRISTDIDRLYPLNTGNDIASGRFKEGRYAILDREGKIIHYFGDYPNYKVGEGRIPNFPKFMFHQSMFTCNNNMLASATAHVLEFVDFSEIQPKIVKRILLSNYDYKYDEGDEWAIAQATDNTQIGVVSLCSTKEYLYLIYNPNTENDPDKTAGNNQIWIFDWDGNPIKKIQPDLHVRCMYVENNNKTVYCVVNAPDPTIASFIL